MRLRGPARAGLGVPADPRADRGGQRTVEVAYGVTSLGRDRADARRLLGVVSRHYTPLHLPRRLDGGNVAAAIRHLAAKLTRLVRPKTQN